MAKSSKSRQNHKPRKPYPDFPLFPHATGRWAKKIRGKLHYFAKWDEPQAALERFKREWPYLSEGRTPPPTDTREGVTLRMLCNAFLTTKRMLLDAGELSAKTFEQYFCTCRHLVDAFGKDRPADDLRPDDFEKFRGQLARRFGPVGLKNEINCCRVVFKYALDQRLIERPVNYGQSFNRPSAKTLRQVRNEAGPRMFEADEILRLLGAADATMGAMILLAVNGGLGNTDIANLPQTAVDFENGWLQYPRAKTAIPRRILLWPETLEALKMAIDERPKPRDDADADLCFLTATGNRWVRVQENKRNPGRFVPLDALSQAFKKLMAKLDMNGHRGYYALRHTFETVAGESRDQVAVNAIMGHVDNSMAGVYRERISDERLRTVVETVHRWLFSERVAANG